MFTCKHFTALDVHDRYSITTLTFCLSPSYNTFHITPGKASVFFKFIFLIPHGVILWQIKNINFIFSEFSSTFFKKSDTASFSVIP